MVSTCLPCSHACVYLHSAPSPPLLFDLSIVLHSEQMVEVILVSDDDSDSDGIDSLIAELFPPPLHELVEIGHFAHFLEPASHAKPAYSNVHAKPASSNVHAKPASKKGPTIWRKPLGQGRDTRNHLKRTITRDGHTYIEYILVKW